MRDEKLSQCGNESGENRSPSLLPPAFLYARYLTPWDLTRILIDKQESVFGLMLIRVLLFSIMTIFEYTNTRRYNNNIHNTYVHRIQRKGAQQLPYHSATGGSICGT